jgi:Ankyrin repeats (3 copies)
MAPTLRDTMECATRAVTAHELDWISLVPHRTKLKLCYAYPYLLLDGFEDHISRPNSVASRAYFASRDTSMHNSNPGSPSNLSGGYLQSPPSVSIEDLKRSETIAEACLRYLIDSSKLPSNDQSMHQCPPDNQILREVRQGTWISHYRFAESFSDSLVGLLDEYLQIWVLDGFNSDISSQVGNCQSFKRVRSPLHFCAALGCERLGNLYLQMGYSPNLIVNGQTPLHLAAAGGHLGIIMLLIGRGANIEARTVATGRTALLLAAFRGHGKTIKTITN